MSSYKYDTNVSTQLSILIFFSGMSLAPEHSDCYHKDAGWCLSQPADIEFS